jgi:hypothetical protein
MRPEYGLSTRDSGESRLSIEHVPIRIAMTLLTRHFRFRALITAFTGGATKIEP